MTVFTEDITVAMPDVYVLTGVYPDAPLVASSIEQAKMLIEAISGVFFSAADRTLPLESADAVWLRKAAVFQAAWLVDQTAVFSRQGVSSLSQDGLSVSARDDLSFVLAPLAKRALNNCSWAKSGTLKVAPAEVVPTGSFLTSDDHAWSPLGAV